MKRVYIFLHHCESSHMQINKLYKPFLFGIVSNIRVRKLNSLQEISSQSDGCRELPKELKTDNLMYRWCNKVLILCNIHEKRFKRIYHALIFYNFAKLAFKQRLIDR